MVYTTHKHCDFGDASYGGPPSPQALCSAFWAAQHSGRAPCNFCGASRGSAAILAAHGRTRKSIENHLAMGIENGDIHGCV